MINPNSITNRFYDGNVATEAYKMNNHLAFQALYAIFKNKGKMPLNATLYKYIEKRFPGEASNAETLSKRLQQFVSAWKSSLEANKKAVENIIMKAYGDFWEDSANADHYNDAMRVYRANNPREFQPFPIYFNVEKYLDAILGDGLQILELQQADNAELYDLASNWVHDVREFIKEYYGEDS